MLAVQHHTACTCPMVSILFNYIIKLNLSCCMSAQAGAAGSGACGACGTAQLAPHVWLVSTALVFGQQARCTAQRKLVYYLAFTQVIELYSFYTYNCVRCLLLLAMLAVPHRYDSQHVRKHLIITINLYFTNKYNVGCACSLYSTVTTASRAVKSC